MKRRLIHALSQRLVRRPVAIISDDCWAGEFYKRAGVPFNTPTIGLFMRAGAYAHFIRQILSGNEYAWVEVASDEAYPVVQWGRAELHLMHYKSADEAKAKFFRRLERMQACELVFKVDFGKAGYDREQIEEWCALDLKDRLILAPQGSDLTKGISKGLLELEDWEVNGAKMFYRSGKRLDVWHWLSTGELRSSWFYRFCNRWLMTPAYWVKEIYHK